MQTMMNFFYNYLNSFNSVKWKASLKKTVLVYLVSNYKNIAVGIVMILTVFYGNNHLLKC